MIFDFSKLRGKIVEVFGSQEKFAEDLGISNVALSNKMTGKTKFSSDDIINISDKLGIVKEDIGVYFFTLKV